MLYIYIRAGLSCPCIAPGACVVPGGPELWTPMELWTLAVSRRTLLTALASCLAHATSLLAAPILLIKLLIKRPHFCNNTCIHRYATTLVYVCLLYIW